jgi:hypothetical protein
MAQMENDSTNAKISSTAACERPYQKNALPNEAALALENMCWQYQCGSRHCGVLCFCWMTEPSCRIS